jgi:RNA polymerase sigma factor FliA
MPTLSKFEMASLQVETELWIAFEQGRESGPREALFTYYVPFAKAMARRHYRRQTFGEIDVKELYQLAYAGLLEAIDRFDRSRGVPFRGYAAYRISGSVRDGISRMSEVREQFTWHAQMRRERTQSLVEESTDGGYQSPIERLSEIAGGMAIGFMLEGTGLYTVDETERAPASASGYESAAWGELIAHLDGELSTLSEREQTILRQHYTHGIGFDIIAIMLGVTKGRISQIHKVALLKLQKRMHGHGHFRLER